MNLATARRLQRAHKIEVVLSGSLVFREEGGYSHEAEFTCLSQNTPGTTYTGRVGYNGVVYTATCTCKDHWEFGPDTPPELVPNIDGIQVCKHCLAALLQLEWAPLS